MGVFGSELVKKTTEFKLPLFSQQYSLQICFWLPCGKNVRFGNCFFQYLRVLNLEDIIYHYFKIRWEGVEFSLRIQ